MVQVKRKRLSKRHGEGDPDRENVRGRETVGMKGDQTETVERDTMLKMDREGSGESLAHRIGGQLRKAGNR